MEKLLTRTGLVSGGVFALIWSIYAGSVTADFGAFEIPSQWLMYGIPGIAGLGTAFMNSELTLPSLPTRSTEPNLTKLLTQLNDVELQIAKLDGPLKECQTLRNFVLEELK